MRKYTRAFVAGSSFLVVVWPFLYLGIPSLYNPGAGFNFVSAAFTLPILVGVLNIIFIAVRRALPFSNKNNYWLFGVFHGLGFSLYGNIVAGIPRDLFLLEGAVAYLTIPAAIIAYSLIWRYIIRNLNIALGIEAK